MKLHCKQLTEMVHFFLNFFTGAKKFTQKFNQSFQIHSANKLNKNSHRKSKNDGI